MLSEISQSQKNMLYHDPSYAVRRAVKFTATEAKGLFQGPREERAGESVQLEQSLSFGR